MAKPVHTASFSLHIPKHPVRFRPDEIIDIDVCAHSKQPAPTPGEMALIVWYLPLGRMELPAGRTPMNQAATHVDRIESVFHQEVRGTCRPDSASAESDEQSVLRELDTSRRQFLKRHMYRPRNMDSIPFECSSHIHNQCAVSDELDGFFGRHRRRSAQIMSQRHVSRLYDEYSWATRNTLLIAFRLTEGYEVCGEVICKTYERRASASAGCCSANSSSRRATCPAAT